MMGKCPDCGTFLWSSDRTQADCGCPASREAPRIVAPEEYREQ